MPFYPILCHSTPFYARNQPGLHSSQVFTGNQLASAQLNDLLLVAQSGRVERFVVMLEISVVVNVNFGAFHDMFSTARPFDFLLHAAVFRQIRHLPRQRLTQGEENYRVIRINKATYMYMTKRCG